MVRTGTLIRLRSASPQPERWGTWLSYGSGADTFATSSPLLGGRDVAVGGDVGSWDDWASGTHIRHAHASFVVGGDASACVVEG